MVSEILWVLGPTTLAAGVVFFPVLKQKAITLLTPTLKAKVDDHYDQLLLILAKLQGKEDWNFNEGKARFPKEGAYKFYIDLEDKHVLIPGDRKIKLTPYWQKQFSVAIAREIADQNYRTIVRHLYPNEELRLLK